jgi:methylthioribose-1-phosphate isomerase
VLNIERFSTGLRFRLNGDSVEIEVLDQRKLPDEENWISVKHLDDMIQLIQQLAVRGAPLIGVAAAVAAAQEAFLRTREGRGTRQFDHFSFRERLRDLRAARPTAVNLMWAVDRLDQMVAASASEDSMLVANRILETAVAIFDEDVEMCRQMGEHGARLIQDGEAVLTICNTGGLATVGIGTAFAALKTAHDQGKKIHVFACETRPLLQGGRLTTWELAKCGIPHTLITDGMAATLMQQGKVHSVFTGADRVSRRGDFANKIGTYSLAVLAHYHRLPFFPVAPLSTVDFNCASGADIEVENRGAEEVRGFVRPGGGVRWAPQGVKTFNPAFDVTPVELVTKIVLNTGSFTASEFQGLQVKGH